MNYIEYRAVYNQEYEFQLKNIIINVLIMY